MKRPVLLAAALGLFACAEPPPPKAPPPPPPPAAPPGEAQTSSVDRSQLPTPGPVTSWAPPAPGVTALKNQIRVWHSRWGSTPLVSLLVVIPRGTATEPPAKAGLTMLMADMLDEGAGKRSALELSEELQRLATDYSSTASVDYTLLSMDLLAENLEPSLALLADMLRRPSFRADEFKRRKDYFIAHALSRESDPGAAQEAVMYDVLYGDGYAGLVPAGTQKSLKSITLADVRAHYKRVVAPEGVEFVVVGGIDQETVNRELEKSFGDWQGKATVTMRPLAEQPAEKGLYMVDFPGAAQSVLSVVRRAEGANTENYFPGLVYNRSFGEAFTSRLNLNLREDKGYTYGARSTFQRYKEIGYFELAASVKTETTRASIDEMLKELSVACSSKPLTQQERDEAVSGLLLGYPGRFESISSVGGAFASLAIFDRPSDWYQKWPGQVQGVSLEAANHLARNYCDPSQFAIVLAGDRAKLQPTFSTLGRSIVGYSSAGTRLD